MQIIVNTISNQSTSVLIQPPLDSDASSVLAFNKPAMRQKQTTLSKGEQKKLNKIYFCFLQFTDILKK